MQFAPVRCTFAIHQTPKPFTMNSKGHTPSELQYKILTARGSEVYRSAPFKSVREVVAAFNTTHAKAEKVSYDKVYRGIRQYGTYAQVLIGIYNADSMAQEVIVVLICAVQGKEAVSPKPLPAQVYQLAGSEPAGPTSLADLGALAKSINATSTKRKSAPKPVPAVVAPVQIVSAVEGPAAVAHKAGSVAYKLQRRIEKSLTDNEKPAQAKKKPASKPKKVAQPKK